MTGEAILALLTEAAKLGTLELTHWQAISDLAATQVQKNLAHDHELKPAPEPGLPKE